MFCNVRISLEIAYEVLEKYFILKIYWDKLITLASGYSEKNYNQRFETKVIERFSGETFKYKETLKTTSKL